MLDPVRPVVGAVGGGAAAGEGPANGLHNAGMGADFVVAAKVHGHPRVGA